MIEQTPRRCAAADSRSDPRRRFKRHRQPNSTFVRSEFQTPWDDSMRPDIAPGSCDSSYDWTSCYPVHPVILSIFILQASHAPRRAHSSRTLRMLLLHRLRIRRADTNFTPAESSLINYLFGGIRHEAITGVAGRSSPGSGCETSAGVQSDRTSYRAESRALGIPATLAGIGVCRFRRAIASACQSILASI